MVGSLGVLWLAVGCGADVAQDEEPFDDALSAQAAAKVAKFAELGEIEPTQQMGVRIRKYSRYLDRSNQAEARFWDSLEGAVSFVNARSLARKVGAQVSVAEVAMNLLAEGTNMLLQQNTADNLDSYTALGLDSLVDSRARYAPLLQDDLNARLKAPAEDCYYADYNELGQPVGIYACLSMEDAVYAGAALLSVYKSNAMAAIPSWNSLSARERFFWTTYFFNAGVKTGKSALRRYGVGHANQPWTGLADTPDNVEVNSQRAKFNAMWRSVGYEYLLTKAIASNGPEPATETGCMWHPGASMTFDSSHIYALPFRASVGGTASYSGVLSSLDRDELVIGTDVPACVRATLRAPNDKYVLRSPGLAFGTSFQEDVEPGQLRMLIGVYRDDGQGGGADANNVAVCAPYKVTLDVKPGKCVPAESLDAGVSSDAGVSVDAGVSSDSGM